LKNVLTVFFILNTIVKIQNTLSEHIVCEQAT